MATTTFSSSYISNAIGLNTAPSISVSGGGGAQEVINSVVAALYLSTSAYSPTYSVTVTVYFSGGSVQTTGSVKFNSGNASGDTFSFAMPYMTAEQCNSITSVRAQCSDSRIFWKHAQYVAVTYTITTACGAPTLSVDNDTPSPSDTFTLSGSGAAAGTNNAITGYYIYRSTNNGVSYSYLQTVSTGATSFSLAGLSPSPTVGESYLYKAITVGTTAGYNSGYSDSVTVTTVSVYCFPPSVLSLSAVTTARKPTLAWSGAVPGAGNAITAYEIEYAESTDGETWGEWTALKTIASISRAGSLLVEIAAAMGSYRKYRIRTQGALGETYYSTWSADSASVRTASSTLAQSQTPKLIAYEYPHVVAGVEKGPYPLGMVSRYSTLIIRRSYQGISSLSLSLPFSKASNDLLACGNLLGVAGKDELYRIVTKTIRVSDTGVEVVELSALSLVSLLGLRVVTSSAVTTGKPVAQILALLRGQPLLMEHYDSEWVQDINGDMLPANYGDRRLPDFHWKAPAFDTEESASLSFQPEKLANLLDTFVALCKVEGCGAKVTGAYYSDVADTLTLWLELYKGIDRSTAQDTNPHIIFDERVGNILAQTYTQSIAGTKTAGYATSKALDDLLSEDLLLIDAMSGNDYYVISGDDVNGGSGVDRAEIGMTVSEVTTPTTGTTQEKAQAMYAACKQIVKNEIAKAPAEVAFEVTLNTGVGPQYGIDYDLGDIVTAMSTRYGVSMNARIAEAVETYEAGKNIRVALTLGESVVTLLGKVKQITRRRG